MVLNLEPLKEPRGFIRIVQIFMAILAFATTTSFDADARIKIECRNANNQLLAFDNVSYHFEYPFEKHVNLQFNLKSDNNICNPGKYPIEYPFEIDKKASSEFYVTTGVLSFLYALAVGVVYVLLTDAYENTPIFPFIDLVATGILAFFWFMAWCVWVAQSNNVKTDYDEVPDRLRLHIKGLNPTVEYKCFNDPSVNFTKLTVSLVFGFGNIILWAGSAWFVYKETHFHRNREMRAQYTPDANGPHHIPSPHQQFS